MKPPYSSSSDVYPPQVTRPVRSLHPSSQNVHVSVEAPPATGGRDSSEPTSAIKSSVSKRSPVMGGTETKVDSIEHIAAHSAAVASFPSFMAKEKKSTEERQFCQAEVGVDDNKRRGAYQHHPLPTGITPVPETQQRGWAVGFSSQKCTAIISLDSGRTMHRWWDNGSGSGKIFLLMPLCKMRLNLIN